VQQLARRKEPVSITMASEIYEAMRGYEHMAEEILAYSFAHGPHSWREVRSELADDVDEDEFPVLANLLGFHDSDLNRMVSFQQWAAVFGEAVRRGVMDRNQLPSLHRYAHPVSAPHWINEMFGAGAQLLTQSGSLIPAATHLSKKKYVGLFFGRDGCPWVRQFIPVLVKFLRDGAAAAGMEAVYVSCDSNQRSHDLTFRQLTGLTSLGWRHGVGARLKRKFNVRSGGQGLPLLVVLDGETGKVIRKRAQSDFVDGNGSYALTSKNLRNPRSTLLAWEGHNQFQLLISGQANDFHAFNARLERGNA
jgi:hypothetical protein